METETARLRDMIHAACLLEATARKPGNVHPEAAFDDLTYADFVRAADIVAPILARSQQLGVGAAVLRAVEQTRTALGKNVNLGIVLLLAPLAAVPREISLSAGIQDVLQRLDHQDAAQVYEAIRIAQPGGMGKVEKQDVTDAPSGTLLEVMQLATDRDQIAAEYTGGFSVVLKFSSQHFTGSLNSFEQSNAAIVHLQLKLLARYGDSLIARKCGIEESRQTQQHAQTALRAYEQTKSLGTESSGTAEIATFDRWLRNEGHRRNPGATADLIAAILFAAFRDRFLNCDAGGVGSAVRL